ncbi:MAG: allantoinase AllB [Spirochaetia bacterium]|jgi:dihydropyrimidinase/allantoinase|nr:allantoinase AllB [Spirochaetia bacterium]
MYQTIITNALVPNGDNMVKTSILIKDGTIVGFLQSSEGLEAEQVIDAKGNLVLPGCIDSHTHYMDPGFTHRETFATGTRSAAAGGVTTIIDMPCCSIPSVRDIPSMQNKLKAIEPQGYVDFGLWGGVTGEDVREGKLDNVQKQVEAGVIGFKVYMTPSVPSYPLANDAELYEIFKEVSKTKLPLGIHAENFTLCDYNVKKSKEAGLMEGNEWERARNVLAEKVAIQMCVSFAEDTGARMHIVHLSSGTGASVIEEAKKRGVHITAETCPHYLLLDGRESLDSMGSIAKIAPPMRIKAEANLLWSKVQNGAIDFIATDHAPYELATEKQAEGMNIWTSFPGIPGTETMVPLMVSEGYNKGRISLGRLVDLLSRNAAIQYGLYPKKGSLEIGADADFTFIDLNKKWKIDKSAMQSMGKYTPFDGWEGTGKVIKTMVRGSLVFDEGLFPQGPGYGKFVKRQTISVLPTTIKF